jgi:hypothetical protein
LIEKILIADASCVDFDCFIYLEDAFSIYTARPPVLCVSDGMTARHRSGAISHSRDAKATMSMMTVIQHTDALVDLTEKDLCPVQQLKRQCGQGTLHSQGMHLAPILGHNLSVLIDLPSQRDRACLSCHKRKTVSDH